MEASWPDVSLVAESMVGGAVKRPPKDDVACARKALVLNQPGERNSALAPPGIFVLDKAFDLIEGHPFILGGSDMGPPPNERHPRKQGINTRRREYL
jgi:hypothetical protein